MTSICRQPFALSFAARGVHRRNLSVLRIDDQRCSPGFADVGPSLPPKFVVCAADVSFRRTIATIHIRAFDNVPFVLRRLLLREKLFSCKLGGSLERRNRGPASCALQIGLSIGCTQ